MSLEQHFVEGSYHKILNSKQNVPLEAYHVFINKFVDAIRYEIARSSEKAYESLKIGDAQRMFMIESPKDLQQFVALNNMKVSSLLF